MICLVPLFPSSELVDLTMEFYRRNYIEGLFLSSGVVRNPDYTMERLVRVAKDLRTIHRFNGYIHFEEHSGASRELVNEAGLYADRLSVNVEIPKRKKTSGCLLRKKTMKAYLLRCVIFSKVFWRVRKSAGNTTMHRFAPAGQSTQMICRCYCRDGQEIFFFFHRLFISVLRCGASIIPDISR